MSTHKELVLGFILYCVALYLLGYAVRMLMDSENHRGYNRAISEMDEYISNAVAHKISESRSEGKESANSGS